MIPDIGALVATTHGIGIVTGRETFEVDGTRVELLAVDLRGRARVLLPLDRLRGGSAASSVA